MQTRFFWRKVKKWNIKLCRTFNDPIQRMPIKVSLQKWKKMTVTAYQSEFCYELKIQNKEEYCLQVNNFQKFSFVLTFYQRIWTEILHDSTAVSNLSIWCYTKKASWKLLTSTRIETARFFGLRLFVSPSHGKFSQVNSFLPSGFW